MALDTATLVNAIASHAASLGVFDSVNGHEPKNAPASELTCAVWAQDLVPVLSSGLASTSARITFNVRLYTRMLQEPADAIDPKMMDAVDLLLVDYIGNFTLGGLLREVDVRGGSGNPLNAQAGYLSQDGTLFRVITIFLPLIINDLYPEAP